LDTLGAGNWDAVIDVSGYDPGTVGRVCEAVKGRAGAYAFVSTISVYAPSPEAPDEEFPVLELPEGADPNAYDMKYYGQLKALCELEVSRHFPKSAVNLRLGLQAGVWDHTDRFGDWIERIGHRDRIIVPGGEPMPWQMIDALDTARFTLHCLENEIYGVYNVDGPAHPMPEDLDLIRQVVNPDCEFVVKSPEWLKEKGVAPWQELALWIPVEMRGDFPAVVDTSRAEGVGLTTRPRRDTIADAWAWLQTLDPNRERTRMSGLPGAKEDALLAS
jgi:2'-hydroxyisoflavone reductase